MAYYLYVTVLEAWYGAPGYELADVKTAVQALLEDTEGGKQAISFKVNNTNLTVKDVNPGVEKQLFVRYTKQISPKKVETEADKASLEGALLPVSQVALEGDTFSVAVSKVSQLQVIKAQYGTQDRLFDITKDFQAWVNHNPDATSITIDGTFLDIFFSGTNPQSDKVKVLFLELLNPASSTSSVKYLGREGQTVSWG